MNGSHHGHSAGSNEPAPSGAGSFRTLELRAYIFDLLICAALGAVGIWFIVNALGLMGGRHAVAPGTLPLILGALLTGLCVVQAVLSIAGRNRIGTVEFGRPLSVALAMVLTLLFPYAMGSFGYYLSAVIWIPAFAWVAGMREPLTYLILTAALLALARFVFEMLLGTPMP